MKRKHVKPKSPRDKVLVVIERLEKVMGATDGVITTCAQHAYCATPD
jgi:hypothetical protein